MHLTASSSLENNGVLRGPNTKIFGCVQITIIQVWNTAIGTSPDQYKPRDCKMICWNSTVTNSTIQLIN